MTTTIDGRTISDVQPCYEGNIAYLCTIDGRNAGFRFVDHPIANEDHPCCKCGAVVTIDPTQDPEDECLAINIYHAAEELTGDLFDFHLCNACLDAMALER
jgi:hypothetical protein